MSGLLMIVTCPKCKTEFDREEILDNGGRCRKCRFLITRSADAINCLEVQSGDMNAEDFDPSMTCQDCMCFDCIYQPSGAREKWEQGERESMGIDEEWEEGYDPDK